MKKLPLSAAVVVALGFTSVFAAEDPMDHAISARKAAFTLIATNFGPLGAMAKEKMPFNNEIFAKRAANIKALSTMPWEFFVPGSDKGESKAKPEIWSNAADFKDKAAAFEQEVSKLVAASNGGDKKAMLAQFSETAKTCKACHKEYKEKVEH